MHIKPNIQIIDLALLVKDVLILTDFHMGYEEARNKRGILLPRFQFKDTMERLKRIFEYTSHNKIKINKILINGDLKHEFGSISETEWRNILLLIDYLRKHCKELIIIKGNHDMMLKPIIDKRDIKLVDFYEIDNEYVDVNKKNKSDSTIVLHGDKIPTKKDKEMFEAYSKANTIVMGNEHPAVSLKESKTSVRKEKCKCFLYGKFIDKTIKANKVKDLIVIPSFNLVTEGTDMLADRVLSPFLKQDLSDFKVWVVADKVYYFGEIGGLKIRTFI